MSRGGNYFANIDWLVIFIYLLLITLGWFNIYASEYDPVQNPEIFDLSLNSGKQLLWIGTGFVLIMIILLLDFRIYESFAPLFYGIFLVLLIGVLFFGREVNGAKAWFEIGAFRLQPAEFTKLVTALVLARYLNTSGLKLTQANVQLKVLLILAAPIALIQLQPDTGSAMIFLALLIPLYREGFPAIYLIVGISIVVLFILTLLVENQFIFIGLGVLFALAVMIQEKRFSKIMATLVVFIIITSFVFATDYLLNDVLKNYQRSRIEAIFKPDLVDPQAEGWNLEQSKIAIGSGGFSGKGFLEGTQTKFGYVPEQSTDFIFSTLAEEHGWLGSAVVIALFIVLVSRLSFIAERQKSQFARFFGYAVAGIIFFHFTINIAMTMGLFPVVGIPLPFFSYGGSSFWSFTVMLFILLKIDMHRAEVLMRN